ncbi:MAG TPA: alpha-ketoacid dehydrogenase subunit beta [Armatimonadota bacterium]|nr:alpha-ketoacid dehydrogenase subunit beta [Armatimonadota bacterium]
MRNVTFVRALNEAIAEEMERDESIFLIGEDIADCGGVFGVTAGMLSRYGRRRVRQTPISEAAFTGLAVGAAMAGLRPIVEIMYVDFFTVCADQILNQAAKLRYMSGGRVSIPMVIRTQQGGGTCEAAQHSQNLEAIFAHVPGLKVVLPATPRDAKGLLKSAIRDDNPVVFLEHKLLYEQKGEMPRGEYLIPLGEADVKREGTDITLVATSLMVHRALAAAEALAGEISVEVIDPRTLVPLDLDCIAGSVRRTGRLLVVQEACTSGGFGSEIVRRIAAECFEALKAPPKVLGSADVPMPFSPVLEQAVLPQEADIVAAVRDLAG